MRSRLKTNARKQSFHIIVGIVAIIVMLLLFGTQLLVGFSALLEKLKGSNEQITNNQNVEYIAPPVLNPIEDATNENSIDVSGYVTSDDMSITLFVNGKPVETQNPDSDNIFTFTNIPLESGDNEITAKSKTTGGKESDYSNALQIKYLNKEPKLEISTPSGGQVFKKDQSPIRISGQTDPGAKITVNDFWAITGESGNFYYDYSLKDGDNSLRIVATDEAGNKTTRELSIKVE